MRVNRTAEEEASIQAERRHRRNECQRLRRRRIREQQNNNAVRTEKQENSF